MDVSQYEDVRRRSRVAAKQAGRELSSITLVAVSKGQGIDAIGALYDHGHRDFGENRAQEMSEKSAALPSDIRWHFVGSLQSNKVRMVRQSTFLLHSLDRKSLATAWVKGIGKPPPAMVQVNVGLEDQKGGVAPADLLHLVEAAAGFGIEIQGLMAIPPVGKAPEDSRAYFRKLRELRDGIITDHPGIKQLSMGMTDDFEIGIAEGASFIRVGRAIFGPRH